MGRRQRRDTQIDRDAVDRDARPAILRTKSVRDVESAEDLEPRDERGCGRPWQRSDASQDAVDAMPDDDAPLLGLDVDVARVRRDPLAEEIVDQTRDRGAVVMLV